VARGFTLADFGVRGRDNMGQNISAIPFRVECPEPTVSLGLRAPYGV
jgi:hypothetical protein